MRKWMKANLKLSHAGNIGGAVGHFHRTKQDAAASKIINQPVEGLSRVSNGDVEVEIDQDEHELRLRFETLARRRTKTRK